MGGSLNSMHLQFILVNAYGASNSNKRQVSFMNIYWTFLFAIDVCSEKMTTRKKKDKKTEQKKKKTSF